jgi:hypothetical protein
VLGEKKGNIGGFFRLSVEKKILSGFFPLSNKQFGHLFESLDFVVWNVK